MPFGRLLLARTASFRLHGCVDDPYSSARDILADPPAVTNWSDCKAQVAPQIVRIRTDDRSGTGFIFYGTDGGNRVSRVKAQGR